MQANSGHPDQMALLVASDLGLHCLWISQSKNTGLIYVICRYMHLLICENVYVLLIF